MNQIELSCIISNRIVSFSYDADTDHMFIYQWTLASLRAELPKREKLQDVFPLFNYAYHRFFSYYKIALCVKCISAKFDFD